MEFIAAAALVALVKKLLDVVKYLRAGDLNGWVTIVASMVVGVLAVLLVAQTDFASAVDFGGVNLGTANFWTLVFVGVTTAASAGLATDTLKSIDQKQTSRVPSLLPTNEVK